MNICPRILPQLAEIDELTRAITRPPAGDLTHNPKPAAKTMGRAELARRKNEYFDEAFSMRGDPNPLHESMRSETIVLMEVKTNVIVSSPQPRRPQRWLFFPHQTRARSPGLTNRDRSEMSSSSSPNSAPSSLSGTSGRSRPSPCTSNTLSAYFMPAPSNQPTLRRCLLSRRTSSPQPTDATPACCRSISRKR